MGLFGSIFGGNRNTGSHTMTGVPAGGSSVKPETPVAATDAATLIDPKREIQIKFGTRTPLPFLDTKTGLTLKVRGFGSASVLVEDTSAYKSAEEVVEIGNEIALGALERFLQENSGKAEFMKLLSRQSEISAAVENALKQGKWKVMNVRFGGLNMDDESAEAYKKFEKEQMLAANPAMAQALAIEREARAAEEAERERRKANGEEEKLPEDQVLYRGNALPEKEEIPGVPTNPLTFVFATQHEIMVQDKESGVLLGVKMRGLITADTEDIPAVQYKGYTQSVKALVVAQLSNLVRKVCTNDPVANIGSHVAEMNEGIEAALLTQGTPVRARVRIEEVLLAGKSRKLLEQLRYAQEMSDPEKAARVIEQKMREQGITPEQMAAATGAGAGEIRPQTAGAIPAQPQTAHRPKFCPNCGSPTGDSGKFCRNCGTKL